MKMVLTTSAYKHFSRLLVEHVQSKGIRLSLEKAGCAGYQYVSEVVTEVPDAHLGVKVEGLMFYVPTVYVNRLDGIQVDCMRDGLLETKVVFDNPNVKMTCGCGESVELKDSIL